jgi:16S rRNA (guanine527-N7)-methyltransferase
VEAAIQRLLAMAITSEDVQAAAVRWGLAEIVAPVADRLAGYGNLLLHWNTRLSLTAIQDEAELIERHLMEGVFAAAHHPVAGTSLDFGSGTGVPGIPIALCREEIHVTLAESQRKKSAFLQEALRTLNLRASVHADRAELLPIASFDAVWMRAVDKSARMLPLAAKLVAPGGTLCLFGTSHAPDSPANDSWQWKSLPIPGAKVRVLHIGRRI